MSDHEHEGWWSVGPAPEGASTWDGKTFAFRKEESEQAMNENGPRFSTAEAMIVVGLMAIPYIDTNRRLREALEKIAAMDAKFSTGKLAQAQRIASEALREAE